MPAETDLGLARLIRWRPDLAWGLAEAYAATEEDLRQWMPAASVEQEDAVSFVAACVDAFEAGRSYAYAIVVEETVIGYCNLTSDEAEPAIAYIAYWVRPEYRRRGIASAAARWLAQTAFSVSPAVFQVHAFVDGANRGSRRVLEKAGFGVASYRTRAPRTTWESDTELRFVRERSSGGWGAIPRSEPQRRTKRVGKRRPPDGQRSPHSIT